MQQTNIRPHVLSKPRTILISGASVAGPALAFWLKRYGFEPTIVEKAPTLRSGGYKVDVRGTAIEVARRMGILDDIHRASTNMQGGTFITEHAKPLLSSDAALFNGRLGEDDELTRGDLSQILYEHTRDDVEYLFSDSIATLEEGSNGVRVTFVHRAPRTFDLVVGADGLHSLVRTLTFGDEATCIQNLGAIVSYYTVPNEQKLDRWELYFSAPGKFVCYYGIHPQKPGKVMLAFRAENIQYDYHNVIQQKQILLETFAQDGWLIPQFLKHVWDSPDFYFDTLSLVHLEHWSHGRMVLLGDAAHCTSPFSGQGTSLALIGAYTLAGELAIAGGDYTSAFTRFEEMMRPCIEKTQTSAAKSIDENLPLSRWTLWFRLQMTRMLMHMPWKRRVLEQFNEEVQHLANMIVLKEYAPQLEQQNGAPHAT